MVLLHVPEAIVSESHHHISIHLSELLESREDVFWSENHAIVDKRHNLCEAICLVKLVLTQIDIMVLLRLRVSLLEHQKHRGLSIYGVKSHCLEPISPISSTFYIRVMHPISTLVQIRNHFTYIVDDHASWSSADGVF